MKKRFFKILSFLCFPSCIAGSEIDRMIKALDLNSDFSIFSVPIGTATFSSIPTPVMGAGSGPRLATSTSKRLCRLSSEGKSSDESDELKRQRMRTNSLPPLPQNSTLAPAQEDKSCPQALLDDDDENNWVEYCGTISQDDDEPLSIINLSPSSLTRLDPQPLSPARESSCPASASSPAASSRSSISPTIIAPERAAGMPIIDFSQPATYMRSSPGSASRVEWILSLSPSGLERNGVSLADIDPNMIPSSYSRPESPTPESPTNDLAPSPADLFRNFAYTHQYHIACTICPQRPYFENFEAFVYHVGANHDQKKLLSDDRSFDDKICMSCSYRGSTEELMSEHIMHDHLGMPYGCSLCPERYTDRMRFVAHTDLHIALLRRDALPRAPLPTLLPSSPITLAESTPSIKEEYTHQDAPTPSFSFNPIDFNTFWETFCPQEEHTAEASIPPQRTPTDDIAVRNDVNAFFAELYEPEGASTRSLPNADLESAAAPESQPTVIPQLPMDQIHHNGATVITPQTTATLQARSRTSSSSSESPSSRIAPESPAIGSTAHHAQPRAQHIDSASYRVACAYKSCAATFSTSDQHYDHFMKNHGGQRMLQRALSSKDCPFCYKHAFPKKRRYFSQHVFKHVTEKHFNYTCICSICEKTIISQSIEYHINRFHGGMHRPIQSSSITSSASSPSSVPTSTMLTAATATQPTMPPQPPTHPTYYSAASNSSVSAASEGTHISRSYHPTAPAPAAQHPPILPAALLHGNISSENSSSSASGRSFADSSTSSSSEPGFFSQPAPSPFTPFLPHITTTNLDTLWETFCPQEEHIPEPTPSRITPTDDITVHKATPGFDDLTVTTAQPTVALQAPSSTSSSSSGGAHTETRKSITGISLPANLPTALFTGTTYHYPIACNACPTRPVFQGFKAFVDHMKLKHDKEGALKTRTPIKRQCHLCDPPKRGSSNETLAHILEKHCLGVRYGCSICPESFDTRKRFVRHTDIKHIYPYHLLQSAQAYTHASSASSPSSVPTSTMLTATPATQSTVIPQPPTHATYYSATSNNSVSGSIQNYFGCNYESCGQVFNNSKDLRKHLDSEHSKLEKPMPNADGFFVCREPGCEYPPTKIRQYFEDHRRTKHCFAQPFCCKYPGCTQSFPRTNSLLRHLKNQHDVHPEQNRGRPSGSSSRETRVGTSPMPTQPMPTLPSADPHSLSSSATSPSSSTATSSSVSSGRYACKVVGCNLHFADPQAYRSHMQTAHPLR